jgi:hypothetical protein
MKEELHWLERPLRRARKPRDKGPTLFLLKLDYKPDHKRTYEEPRLLQ